MNIAVIGAGRIGGNIAQRLAGAGHDLAVAFARDPEALASRAGEIGARALSPREAGEGSEVVVLSVPWDAIPEALGQTGPLDGRVVIDTTNQFGSTALPAPGQTAASFNAARMPGARYTKSFNTLTSAFQRAAGPEVVQWLCGDDEGANKVVSGLIRDGGYTPVYLGGTADCAVMEAPRREGAVYGEEYREPEALAVVEAVREGRPIAPTPSYRS
jgi:8-hydroxy-5-deazaflavin:NADPH oxidoreductase